MPPTNAQRDVMSQITTKSTHSVKKCFNNFSAKKWKGGCFSPGAILHLVLLPHRDTLQMKWPNAAGLENRKLCGYYLSSINVCLTFSIISERNCWRLTYTLRPLVQRDCLSSIPLSVKVFCVSVYLFSRQYQ